MQRRRSRTTILQYVVIGILVLVLLFMLNRRAHPVVFTLVFLGGVILAALPSILAGADRFRSKGDQPQDKSSAAGSRPSMLDIPVQMREGTEAASEAARPWFIRPLLEDDLIEVAALLRIAFEEYRGFLEPPSGAHKETSEQLRLVLKDSRALVAVLRDPDPDGENGEISAPIVGCVFYQYIIDHVYLFRLAVLPEHRRKGIARALIEQVEEIARQAGVHWVQLGVRTQLPKNQLYYEKQGYVVLRYESHKDYTTPTVVILQKRV